MASTRLKKKGGVGRVKCHGPLSRIMARAQSVSEACMLGRAWGG